MDFSKSIFGNLRKNCIIFLIMAKFLHTAEQVEFLRLPGYKRSADIHDVFLGDNDWQPILSLSIFREGDNGLEILTGLRREDTHATHPGVVSTPTKRMPSSIAKILFSEKLHNVSGSSPFNLGVIDPTHPEVVARFSPNTETVPDSSSMLPFLAADLMARKLGLADALERSNGDNPLGKVSLMNIIAGFSNATVDPVTEENLFEPLIVFGAATLLDRPDEVPVETASYRNLTWVNADNFVKGVEQKDAPLLIEGLTVDDEISVCVRGLCLATSRSNLIVPGVTDHLGIAEQGLKAAA